MADWKAQYLGALEARDQVEKAQLDVYSYCTRLADEKAKLIKELASTKAAAAGSAVEASPAPPPPPAPLVSYGFRRQASPQPLSTIISESTIVTQLRQDLAKAQQERADLQSRLDAALRELESLVAKGGADRKKLTKLVSDVNQTKTKLRDREEELRGKTKLVVDVQDENVTLTLQLNMAEEKVEKLHKENKELVDRWMARVGKEADQMNADGRF